MEIKASAKVAMREEVWRRRNWLRFACHETRAEWRWKTAPPQKYRQPPRPPDALEINSQRRDEWKEHEPDALQHRFGLGAQQPSPVDRRRPHQVGSILAGDGKPGQAARQLARRHHQHRHQHNAAPPLPIIVPEQERGRGKIQQLDKGLGNQPGIPQDQEVFLAAEAAPGVTTRNIVPPIVGRVIWDALEAAST